MKLRLYNFLTLIFLSALFVVALSCQKEEATSNTLPYQVDGLFTAEEEAILGKSLDTEKFTYIQDVSTPQQYKIFLGRVLFYDAHLSKDESVSCASCHQQQYAFADNVALSTGASGNITDRNSISLASFTSFSGHYNGEGGTTVASIVDNSFFWDERVADLSDQMMETFANPKEMGMNLVEIGQRVEALDYAQLLYDRAFKGAPVTTQNVVEAIGAFVNQIKSADAPFDIGLSNARFLLENNFPSFTTFQNRGKQLFLSNCASCHAFSLNEGFRAEFQNMQTVASNGLELNYSDQGLATHTLLPEEEGLFKIPGLRNVELTAPYMHDGRFATLEEVVDFYSSGIQAHPNLSPVLKAENDEPVKMNFSTQDKSDLVAFLKTLTGTTPMTDASLSNPFK